MAQYEQYDQTAAQDEGYKELMAGHSVKDAVETAEAEPTPAQQLGEWWEQLAHDEIAPLIAKMQEYGGLGRALDLVEIGRAMRHAGAKVPPHAFEEDGDAQLAELGIYFYLQGKFARWTAAIAEGRAVSDDTLHDIGIYVRMVQRIRAVGGWPV